MQSTALFDLNHDFLERSDENTQTFFEEYHSIVNDLKQEINNCKDEQTRLRDELECIKLEDKSWMQNYTQMQNENCPVHSAIESNMVRNLEKRLNIMQIEKDSLFQLWQTSLKAINVLEEELTICQQKRINSPQQEDTNHNRIKELYATAVQELEEKLIESKETLLLHQSLFDTSRTKIDELSLEKEQLTNQLKHYKEILSEKDAVLKNALDEVSSKVKTREDEIEELNKAKVELLRKLNETQKSYSVLVARENESLAKVSEALELVDVAVKEKEDALKRESKAQEESSVLLARMNAIDQEYSARLKTEVAKLKELHDSNLQKYITEIDEMKMEIQHKAILSDRAQRECRLAQEELDKLRQESDNFCQKSESKIIELEKKLREAELRLQSTEETWKLRYSEKCRVLEQYDKMLTERLVEPNEKLRSKNNTVEDLVKEVNERTKEAVQKYSDIERSLSRNFGDRDKLEGELRNLQSAFERETDRRDREKRMLELKIKSLQEDLSFGPQTGSENRLAGEILVLRNQILRSAEEEIVPNCKQSSDNDQVKKIKEMTDTKIRELTEHVEAHKKLSNRCKEELELMTSKFSKHSKEMKKKMQRMQEENEKLNRELYVCRQKLGQFNYQFDSW